MKVGIAGQGAFGVKHLEAIQHIPDIEVITLTGGNQVTTREVAKRFKIPHYTGDLAESLKQPGLEAMILATPTQMHAKQGVQCMRAGKHVQIEIPVADSLADSEMLVKVQKETGAVCMGGHTRRFNPSHQYIHNKTKAGELKVQQMNVQTYFFRRTNMNAAGQPRSWTDHLLWHHACHTVDLFQYQTGELVSDCYGVQGPIHPELKIAMDMGIVMKVPSGAICTLSLSFNNKGPLGTRFRYICDNGTYQAYYDDLVDGEDKKIDLSGVAVSMNGIELQDREFFSAIKEKREPNASVQQCYAAMQVLDRLEKILNSVTKAQAVV
jgi:2-hydroxy-4-carboxymuconate semialdehyde hemiacetal dehydrogenase